MTKGNPMNTTAIRLEKINKIFRTRHRDIHALSDVDLTVGQGEFVSLVGPSGCGKSTILRMLANIVRPTSGHISINGVEVSSRSRWPESLVRSIGLVFQAPNLLPWLTVRENIALPPAHLPDTGSRTGGSPRRSARPLRAGKPCRSLPVRTLRGHGPEGRGPPRLGTRPRHPSDG